MYMDITDEQRTADIKVRIIERVGLTGTDAQDAVLGRSERCWLWPGATKGKGHGKRVGVMTVDGRAQRVHRLAWFAWGGTLPPGHVLHNTCGKRLCANPRHWRTIHKRSVAAVAVADRVVLAERRTAEYAAGNWSDMEDRG